MKAIVKRFEGSGVLVIQTKVSSTPGLACQLLKTKVQDYYHDFTLYFINLVISLQSYCSSRYLKTYFVRAYRLVLQILMRIGVP